MTPADALRVTFGPTQLRRSLAVAAIVGTVLNLINQSDAFFGSGKIVIWRLLLTYCVPFLVASYGAYSALRTCPEPGGSDPR